MNTPAATPSGRLEYLDLIRGVFILVMIEGHTLRLFLSPEIKATFFYQYQDLIHNLTGPVFLFAAGAAYVYSTHSRWELLRHWGPRLRGRLKRWLTVLAIGYSLQLTYGTLRRSLAETTPEQLAYLVSLNILQCIVYSLVLLRFIRMIVPNWQWFFRVSLAAALGIALLTPFAWEYGREAPAWLGSLLSIQSRSIFPMFPYAGFTFAGAAFGYLHLLARERGGEEQFLRHSALFAAGLCLAGLAAGYLPLPSIYADFWGASPLSFLVRVGILTLIAIAGRHAEPRFLSGLRPLAVIGKQSLLIYVLHLPILYGSAFNPDTSLRKGLGVPLPLAESILVCLGLGALLVAVALWWDWWRKDHRGQARAVWWLIVAYYSYRFFLA